MNLTLASCTRARTTRPPWRPFKHDLDLRYCSLLRMRTREGMAVAEAKGTLRGKQPKLSSKHQRGLLRMYGTGEYTIADPAEVFAVSRTTVSRTTVYCTLQRKNRSVDTR